MLPAADMVSQNADGQRPSLRCHPSQGSRRERQTWIGIPCRQHRPVWADARPFSSHKRRGRVRLDKVGLAVSQGTQTCADADAGADADADAQMQAQAQA